MQKSVDLIAKLVEFARTLPTFDSHEHLVPETEHMAGKVDFSKFIEMYVPIHMRSAGAPESALHRLFHCNEHIGFYQGPDYDDMVKKNCCAGSACQNQRP
jgi:hypothetical protein